MRASTRPIDEVGRVSGAWMRPAETGPLRKSHADQSVIHDELVAFLLKPHELEDGRGDGDRARDEVRHDLVDDLICRLAVGVAIVGDRQTGVSMRGLVSSQENDAPFHQGRHPGVVPEALWVADGQIGPAAGLSRIEDIADGRLVGP